MPIYKTERKKDGKQGYRVRVNYVDNMGKKQYIQKIVYGSTEAKMAEVEIKKELTIENPTKKIKIKELSEEYFVAKSSETRETTLDKIKRNVKYHIYPTFESLTVDKLSNKQILQKWKNKISNSGLSIRTQQNIYR